MGSTSRQSRLNKYQKRLSELLNDVTPELIGSDAVATEVLAMKEKAKYWRDWAALELDGEVMMESANDVLVLVTQVNEKLRLYIE